MTDPDALPFSDALAILSRVQRAWDRVVATTTTVTRRVHLAGVDFEIVIAGDELAGLLLPAFGRLEPARGPLRGTVGAWDAAATGIGFPPRPPIGGPGGYHCVVRRGGYPTAELAWPTNESLQTGDREAGRHLMAVASAATLPPGELGAPLRRQLRWVLSPEVLFVHAAAVGTPRGAALIMGPGGAGKSSTSLACLRAGMGFLSDDYCLVEGHPPVVHRLHTSARLSDDDAGHFRDSLEPAISGASFLGRVEEPDAKALYLLHDSHPDRMLACAPVRTVLLPEVRGEGAPRLEPIGAAEALRSNAGAFLRMSVQPDRELASLRRLVTTVPCYRLVLSREREANPPLVMQALADASP